MRSSHGDRAVGVKGSYWNPGDTIRIKFLDGIKEQRDFVKATCVEWLKYANVKFEFIESGDSEIRIRFNANDGAWSYIGTECKSIPQTEQTMNLGWLDVGVVLHEFGHALGLAHEHQNPTKPIRWNEAAVIKALSGSPNFWDLETIRANVLDRIPVSEVDATALDRLSIMEYPIPATWTLDGFSAGDNQNLSDMDKSFIAGLYPFPTVEKSHQMVDLSHIFRTLPELNQLSAALIVRVGTEIGAVVDAKFPKKKNVETVFKKINP